MFVALIKLSLELLSLHLEVSVPSLVDGSALTLMLRHNCNNKTPGERVNDFKSGFVYVFSGLLILSCTGRSVCSSCPENVWVLMPCYLVLTGTSI